MPFKNSAEMVNRIRGQRSDLGMIPHEAQGDLLTGLDIELFPDPLRENDLPLGGGLYDSHIVYLN